MKLFRNRKNQKSELNQKNEETTELTHELLEALIDSSEKEIVFLCIGSDRAVVDSLAPLVGTMLKEKNFPYCVYGTLNAPVHALNLEIVLEKIHFEFDNCLLLVLDACIGKKEEVGTVFLKTGPLYPGKAIGNQLPPVGDYHLLAVVNYWDEHTYENYLTDTRLVTIYEMAKRTSELLLKVASTIQEKLKKVNQPTLYFQKEVG